MVQLEARACGHEVMKRYEWAGERAEIAECRESPTPIKLKARRSMPSITISLPPSFTFWFRATTPLDNSGGHIPEVSAPEVTICHARRTQERRTDRHDRRDRERRIWSVRLHTYNLEHKRDRNSGGKEGEVGVK